MIPDDSSLVLQATFIHLQFIIKTEISLIVITTKRVIMYKSHVMTQSLDHHGTHVLSLQIPSLM